ncbi:hypothetical protein QFZ23_003638 [Arthrobacter globiformis]|uniref:hypothetical protein n=1 Tax=Arthrobacter globiformis TaxID=1665 RepID=UPI0027863DC2|nr:hypothetical protein [Arthrobacter globiformis]MDQ1059737.1 hypothetical protein [Arthrobacter globiformis]
MVKKKWQPVFCGGLLAALGFGVMLGFWSSGGHADGVPGLLDYRGATWGDGLFLPVLAASLVTLIGRLPAPADFRVRASAGIMGGVAGLAVIVQWLLDPSPGLNWTMPGAHYLNWPGRWHAAFLVGACATFGWLWGDFFDRLRRSFKESATAISGRSALRSGAFAWVIGSSLAFGAAAGLDSINVGTTRAGLTSLAFLLTALVLVTAALVWAARGEIVAAGLPTLVGGILFLALMAVSMLVPPDLVVILFVVSAAAFGLAVALTAELNLGSGDRPWVFNKYPSKGAASLELLAIPALFVLLPIGSSSISAGRVNQLLPLAGLLLAVLLFVFIVRGWRRGEWRPGKDYPWIAISILFVLATAGVLPLRQVSGTNDAATSVFFALLATLLAGPTIKLCQVDAQVLVKMEWSQEYLENGSKHTARQKPVAWWLRVRLAACTVAAMCSVFGLTILTARSVGWSGNEQDLPLSHGLWLGAGLVVVGPIFLIHQVTRSISLGETEIGLSRRTKIATAAIWTFSGCALVYNVFSHAEIFDLWAAFQSSCVALFAGECVLSNGLRLGLQRLTMTSTIMVSSITLGIFSVAYWTLTMGVGTTIAPVSVVQSFVALMVGYGIVGLLTVVATTTVYGEAGVPNRPLAERFGNAVQNALMLLPMWMLLCWLPRTISAHIPERSEDLHRWVAIGLIYVGFLALYCKALVWLTETNDIHVGSHLDHMKLAVPAHFHPHASHWIRIKSLRGRIADYSFRNDGGTPEERRGRALSTHTAMQNVLAFSLVAITVLGAFWLFPVEVEA